MDANASAESAAGCLVLEVQPGKRGRYCMKGVPKATQRRSGQPPGAQRGGTRSCFTRVTHRSAGRSGAGVVLGRVRGWQRRFLRVCRLRVCRLQRDQRETIEQRRSNSGGEFGKQTATTGHAGLSLCNCARSRARRLVPTRSAPARGDDSGGAPSGNPSVRWASLWADWFACTFSSAFEGSGTPACKARRRLSNV